MLLFQLTSRQNLCSCPKIDTRRAYMLRNKHPGPYDDTFGPTVLGIILMMSIVSQFVIKLNAIVS